MLWLWIIMCTFVLDNDEIKTYCRNEDGFCSFGLLMAAVPVFAQNTGKDSIVSTKALDDVVVSASNISRVGDHLVIYPNSQQRKHAVNGFGVLENLNIPGLIIDAKSNQVDVMGLQATLYLNGQECDIREIQMLRPRDIEKIEYHDAPSGKYAKDKLVVNFITKQYRYGGYVQADGLQTIGYDHGDYNVATNYVKGNNSYTVFAGANYSHVDGTETWNNENYQFPQSLFDRESYSKNSYRNHQKYMQFRYQNQKGKRYWVGKFTLLNLSTPRNASSGFARESTETDIFSNIRKKSLSPKIDLNANLPLSKNQTLTLGVHGKYSANSYHRLYQEQPFEAMTDEDENALSFQLSAIYNYFSQKHSLSVELFHYHDVWNADYSGNCELWQHLWKGESLAFFSYNFQASRRLSLKTRIGLDWLQYHLHGDNSFSQLSPRINTNVQYQLNKGMLLWSFNFVNSNHGMDVINRAMIQVNSHMMEKGMPELKKSHDINTYLYYMGRFNRLSVSAIGQFRYNHHPVTDDYYLDEANGKIVKTYSNGGNAQYYSAILALQYKLCKFANLSGDIRYNHAEVKTTWSKHNNNLTGNLGLNMFMGDFALKPYLHFGKKSLDEAALVISKTPIDYGMSCSYSRGNLYVELQVVSPFKKQEKRYWLDLPIYSYSKSIKDQTASQYASIKVAYSFDFGRKTQKVEKDVNKNINSSLLRVE